MKTLTLKLARLAIVWSEDILRLCSEQLYYYEHGKTVQEAAREFLKGVPIVSAHEAKQMFLDQKKKGTGVN